MRRFWLSPKRIYRLHGVCWSAYKRCWKGGRSPLADTREHIRISANQYRDLDRNEFTQVTVSCECGRGGWLRLTKHLERPPKTLLEESEEV